jgi:hypothetical protein
MKTLKMKKKKTIINVLIVFFSVFTSEIYSQVDFDNEGKEEYLISLLDNLRFQKYYIGVSDNQMSSNHLSPGCYIKTNLTIEQRNNLLNIPSYVFLSLLKKNDSFSQRVNILLYDLTQTEATVLINLINDVWSESICRTEYEYWKQRENDIEFKSFFLDSIEE